jgi:8-oxo-dGTP pyrophosphatase MutT (NUDIX family)
MAKAKGRTKRGKPLFRTVLAKVKRWLEGEEAGQWRSAGGVVVDRKGAVALIRQKKKWTFPKGRVDPGEGINQAARREVYEETGLRVRIVSYLGVLVGVRHVTHYFLMRLEKDDGVHDDEVDEVRFVKLSKAEDLLGSRRDRWILERAQKVLAGREPKRPTINP